MPRSQRQLVHGIAEQYGLATASTGQEPRRCVELFKTGTNPGLPSRLLSRVAPTVLDEEVAALLVAAQGHPIRFIDIAPTTDLHYYLRRWDGRYCTEWKGGSEAIVRFDDAATKTEVLDAFGGGIRGLFKVDRAWHPQVAVPTSGGAASATGMKGWGAGAASGDGGEGLSSGASWTAVAAPQRAAQGQASTGSGGGEGSAAALPTGWSVIGGKREVRPVIRPVATANGAAEAAQPNAGRLAALSLEDLESS